MVRKTAFVILSIFLASCYDLRLYEVYSDADEARADGGVERGWLPDWLPDNAINIHDYHDLDTNIRAISFGMRDSRAFVLPDHCIAAAEVLPPRLKTKLFPRSLHKKNGIMDCVDLFVFQEQNGMVHAWSTHNGR